MVFQRTGVVVGTLVSILAVSGCTGTKTVSSYARAGDTVTVALGPDDGALLRRADLIAEIVDSGGTVVPVRIRDVIHIYADPTSRIGSTTGNGFNYLGQRIAVVDLITPSSTVSSPVPVTISIGTGNLRVKKIVDGSYVAQNTQIQILSGTGSPNPLVEQTLSINWMETTVPRPQVRFKIVPINANPQFERELASIEVTLRYPASAAQSLPPTGLPQAIHLAPDQHLQFLTRHYQQGSDNVIKMLMLNPHGIKRAESSTQPYYEGLSRYDALRFAIAWGDAVLMPTYPADTFDRSVIENANVTLAVFDANGVDATSLFQIVRQ